MGKRASYQDLALRGQPALRQNVHWFSQELRRGILEGRLQPGTRLPSTRGLARQHGVARGTVVAAYEQLLLEGYLTAKIGRGTFVTDAVADDLLEARTNRALIRSRRPMLIRLSRQARDLVQTPFPSIMLSPPARPFASNQPAMDLFPVDLWNRLASRRHRRSFGASLAQGDVRGHEPLREAIAGYLGTARGVRCSAREVVIVSGVQQALDLTARLLLEPGDAVWMEDPGYPGASRLFRAAGARVASMPIDAEGARIADAEARAPDARLAYVTPGRQWPLGMPLALDRRLRLLAWARRARAVVFEDDYDSEYRYEGRPLGALQGLDEAGVVVYAGTFSKLLFPSLRIGYVVLPPSLVESFVSAKSLVDRFCPPLPQAVLCDFIVEGHFVRHIRRMREIYAHRRDTLIVEARRELGGLLELVECEAGMDTVGWLPDRIDDRDATAAASKAGIDVLPLSRCTIGEAGRAGLVLGFGPVKADAIRTGVERLARAIRGLHKRSHS
jgi:GntR family transcriptional regulator/MocR family aminotransferase